MISSVGAADEQFVAATVFALQQRSRAGWFGTKAAPPPCTPNEATIHRPLTFVDKLLLSYE